MVYNVTEISASPCSPLMEQSNVYNTINFAFNYQDPNNTTAMYTVVNQFVCPSDYCDPLPALGGQTNYMADMGSGIVWQEHRPQRRHAEPQRRFLRRQRHPVRIDHRRVVQHRVFSERVMADGNNAIVSPVSDVFFSPLAPTTPDQAYQRARQWTSGTSGTSSPCSWAPRGFAVSTSSLMFWPELGASAGSSCRFAAVMPPSSRHPGGVNLLLGNGSVRFAKDSINLASLACAGHNLRRRNHRRR